ncbi:MAG: hypothetical protein MI806_19710 [Minwuiales bacterium]|nr:hypothetical protein [Minwuiales bacterium]
MGGGLLFLAAIIGVAVVLIWSLKNDNVPNDGKTTGLLAMKEPDEPAQDTDETGRPRR